MTTKRVALLDVGVILVLAGAYVLAEMLSVPKRWTFLGIALALLFFGAEVIRRHMDWFRELGLRGDNFVASIVPIGAGTLLASGAILIWAVATGRGVWHRDMLLLLPIYPIWGVVQQTIFQGVFHRRMMCLVRNPAIQVIATALLFSAVHFGNPALMALTFVAGLIWSIAFRVWPNTLALGLSHGVLAAVVYPIILHDAPLTRI